MGIAEPITMTGNQRAEWAGENMKEGAIHKVPMPKNTIVERRSRPTNMVMGVPAR